MNKMLVAVFDTETAASEGLTRLKELHKDGDITLYATTVLSKDSAGKVVVRQAAAEGPAGTALGFLTGGLLGLLGGPAGIPVGAAIGGLTGLVFDLDKSGISVSFVDDVSKALLPGKAAVIADIDENWTAPVDTRLHKHGGVVFRRLRSEVVEDQLNREAAAFRADLTTLGDEMKQAGAESKAAIQNDIDAVKKQLKATQDLAKARLEEAKAEVDAKLKALEDQAKSANGRARTRIENRIGDVKANFAARSMKLNQAWNLTKEALGPEAA